ncbi:hypothetical protein [Streptomyces sp. C1-2]|uniref:hypothetical protein n=1 Tax=Streptomyces sp. C1-2 TaxID=2720022 RepID=UPI00143243FE|nr:hypothetical protein [Streptomyces sp. C1-2]NJP74418.1 hypothetical protein [Streptomyces sp. C1-2]
MEALSLEDLRETDGRSLHFTPYGFGGPIAPEEALAFQQHVIGQHSLADDVAEGTRRRFEQLRHVYRYGLLCYDLFTMVSDAALLVFEQALRDRFVEFYGGTVTFRDSCRQEHDITFQNYADFMAQFKARGGTKIKMGSDRRWTGFNGMLDGLYRWARREGLLRGQRNRSREPVFKELRNMVAHPSGFHLDSPADAARRMSDLAETINQLWGSPTPGGRLHPAPVERQPVAIGCNDAGSITICQAASLHTADGTDGWEFVLVQAVFSPGESEDPTLTQFDALFENTTYPCDLMWGPGMRAEALAWLETAQPGPDTRDHLDPVFLLRYDGKSLHLPQRPEVAAGLPSAATTGTWFAIRADAPSDAFVHVRELITQTATRHAAAGECQQCAADTLKRGTWEQALAAAERAGASGTPEQLVDVRTPSWMPRKVAIDS